MRLPGMPPYRDTAKADPVIATLATNQPGAGALTASPLPGQRDFQRGIDRLGTRVGVEDMAKPLGSDLHQPVG